MATSRFEKGPLVISCLKGLFEKSYEGVPFEDAEQSLIEILRQHSNREEFDVHDTREGATARKELRDWIKRGLIVERGGKILATDALQQTFKFIEGLEERIMTSTSSRLATVQREIENLEITLSTDPKARTKYIENKIAELEKELEEIKKGNFAILPKEKTIEAIRDIYHLSMSLRSDFRKVEDSYREADKELRQSIVSEQHNRGEIVESLLNDHSALLSSPEGQVFHGFYDQLMQHVDIDKMRHRLEKIAKSPLANKALRQDQLFALRRLITQLVKESDGVIRARSHGERDVKNFLKTGIAEEHHRVGQVLKEVFRAALDINWSDRLVRKSPVSLPLVGMTLRQLPLTERLLFYQHTSDDEKTDLNLNEQSIRLDDIQDDFWNSYDSFDEEKIIQETLDILAQAQRPMSIAELARHISCMTHDLETIFLWVLMAREAALPVSTKREEFEIVDDENKRTLFSVPKIMLAFKDVNEISWEY